MAIKFMLCDSIHSLNEIVIDRYYSEEKYDGERIIAVKIQDSVSLLNRRGVCKEEIYLEIGNALKKIPFDFIIDGEVIATTGLFNDLQKRALVRDKEKIATRVNTNPVMFMVFDILNFKNQNVMLKPLMERKQILKDNFEHLLENIPAIKLVEYVEGDKKIKALWEKIKLEKKEGIILKIKDSIYVYKRSNSWIKYKNFSEIEISFNAYEVNNAGVKLNDGFNEVQVQGIPRANWIIEKINKGEPVKVIVQFLEKIKLSGKLRMPSCKEVIGYD